MRRLTLLAATALMAAAPVAAAPSADLARVIADHWQLALTNDPFLATKVGDHRGDGKLPDASLAAADRAAATEAGFIARLDRINTGLTAAERVNKGVMRRMPAAAVAANGFGQRAITFTTYSGWHTGFASYPDQATLRTAPDYDWYLARLAAYPLYNRQQIEATPTGIAAGYAQPCAPLKGFESSINAYIVAEPEKSVFWAPFAKPVRQPCLPPSGAQCRLGRRR